MDIISGKIINYIFKNALNNYKIAKIQIKDSVDSLIIVGYFPELPYDIYYEFQGEYTNHVKYGEQFKVHSFKQCLNNSKEGIIAYLSSDLFLGIGPKTALKIYNKFGNDCINKIIDDKNILDELGFNAIKKERFYQSLIENSITERILIQLYSYGLGSKTAMKLYDIYQDKTIDFIIENPYRLIDEVKNFGFKKADEIALSIGITDNDIRRLDAGIFYVLENYCFQNGHTYALINEFIKNVKIKLKRVDEIDEILIYSRIDELVNNGKLIKKNEKIFISYFYEAEQNISLRINNFLKSKTKKYDDNLILKAISYVENKNKILYSEMQKEAIKEALNNNISIITGGPGTGKTTVVNGILKAYAFLNDIDLAKPSLKISLVAPTGRAAKRMEETTLFNAKTIHRLLGYGYDEQFLYNKENLLPCDILIVDESSMIDIFLASKLLDAVKLNCKIIFVGDEDQLPSVSPGQVLKDLIESNRINVIRLTEIHRQALDSNIIKLSYAVKNGALKQELFNYNDDLSFIKVDDLNIFYTIKLLINDMINKGYSILNDIQILIPMYKGINGIDNINLLIENEFNKNEIITNYQDKTYKIGDKVLQLVNNPIKNIMNGDIGIIINIIKNDDKDIVFVKYDDVIIKYEKEELEEITLAYAISIHKSQGSEYPIVILPIVKSYSIMLKKKLVYTAITRAKKNLIILGNLNYLEYGINSSDEKRYTYLKSMLQKNDKLPNISPYDFLK